MSEPQDDLDLLLKWGLRDLYPEVEPPLRVWEKIRARVVAALPGGLGVLYGQTPAPRVLERIRALLAPWPEGIEAAAWVPERVAMRSRLPVPPRPGESIYDAQQTTIHLWVLANALGSHAF